MSNLTSSIIKAEVLNVKEVPAGIALYVKLEDDSIYPLTVGLREYVAPENVGDKGEYVDSPELVEKVNKALEELGFEETADSLINLEKGTEINLHFDDDSLILSIFPIKSFTKFVKLNDDKALANHIQDSIDDNIAVNVESTEFSEYEDGCTFNFGVKLEGLNGEEINVRLSGINVRTSTGDERLPLKYHNKHIKEALETRRKFKDDPDSVEEIELQIANGVIKSQAPKMRARLIDDFKKFLGIDIEEFIQNGTTVIIPKLLFKQAGDNVYVDAQIKDAGKFREFNGLA